MIDLKLRPAIQSDARWLWELRNDLDVRKLSGNSDEVSWDTHVQWLSQRLASSDTRLWIVEVDGDAIGQVRFDRCNTTATVSVSLCAASRGKGYGRQLLQVSAEQACSELGVVRLRALVKPNNTSSLRAFDSAGFVRTASVVRDGNEYVLFERPCSRTGGGA